MNFYNNKSHFNVCLKAFERNGLSSDDRLPMSDGAQIWKVDQNGNETLVAVLENIGGNKKIFKKVIYE